MDVLPRPVPILFRKHDGTIVREAIRAFFMADILLEPYAPNQRVPAAVLTEHSWTPMENVVEFLGP